MDSFNSPWPSPPRGLDALSNEALQMDMITDLQEQFEPQTRARSNTWPLPRPENFVEPTDDSGSTKCSNQQLATCGTGAQSLTSPSVSGSAQKKNSSRRNAWGNLSYADLITQAIGSASDNRLTLSQIYEWMVQNVPYFKDKGDSNSSAGWKNSIRHNLSLHNRFMRVQNEGTGKSSWWMLNPDAKPGKSVRRRAASMETSKYEKRRGRAKKRVEDLRSAGLSVFDTGIMNDVSPSPSSSISECLDQFPDSPLHSSGGFQLSPDFRQRASSNASSVGRLSPIPAVVGLEPDWIYTPPGVQPQSDYAQQDIDTADGSSNLLGLAQSATDLDQLAGSLADDLSLQKEFLQGFSNASSMHSQPPPPYQPPQPYSLHASVAQSYGIQTNNQCTIHRRQQCTCMHNSRESMSPSSGTGMSPAYPHSEPSPDPMGTYSNILLQSRITARPNSDSPPNQTSVNCHNKNNNNNTHKDPSNLPIILNNTSAAASASANTSHTDMSSHPRYYSGSGRADGSGVFNGTEFLDYTDSNMPSTLMGQFMEALNSQSNLDDLALNIDSFQGGLECNVDEVIQQELNIDGLLDINIPISNHNHAGSLNSLTQSSSAQTHSSQQLQQQQQQHLQHQQQQQQQATMGALSISQPNQTNAASSSHAIGSQYPQTSVTPPSWVH